MAHYGHQGSGAFKVSPWLYDRSLAIRPIEIVPRKYENFIK